MKPVAFYPTLRGDFISVKTGENEYRVGYVSAVTQNNSVKEWRPLSTTKVLLAPSQPYSDVYPAWSISQNVMRVGPALRHIKANHHRDDLPNEPEPFESLQDILDFIEAFITEPIEPLEI